MVGAHGRCIVASDLAIMLAAGRISARHHERARRWRRLRQRRQCARLSQGYGLVTVWRALHRNKLLCSQGEQE